MIDDSVAMTPFYLLLGKHRQQQQENQDILSTLSAERTPLPQGSVAIKEVSSAALHGLSQVTFIYISQCYIFSSGGFTVCVAYNTLCHFLLNISWFIWFK